LSLELRDILKESRTTALMVTHDQYEAFAIADVIGLMHAGQIEQWDTAYNLYHRPATRFAADFIGQGVFLPGQARGNSIEIELGVLERDDVDTAVTKRDVLLRPDDVVHDDASPVTAEVLRKSFRGAEFLYTLKLASGEQVLALVPSHHNHAIGERIGIRLEADHVVSFPKQ
jgi:iron(III) transport system ATP-binding protein